MTRQSDREALLSQLAPVVAEHGLDLEDVTVTPAGKRRLLRVIVDGDDGVSLDAVAAVSTDVSRTLDESDVMGGQSYVLEVTSPGVDRPLTQPRHWRRSRGRLVKLSLTDGGSLEGRVTEAGDDSVLLDVDGMRREVAYPDITGARVQVEFNRKDGA